VEFGHNLSLVENFYSPRIWSPEYPRFKNVYDKKPACNEKNFGPLLFRYRQVSLYQFHVVYFSTIVKFNVFRRFSNEGLLGFYTM